MTLVSRLINSFRQQVKQSTLYLQMYKQIYSIIHTLLGDESLFLIEFLTFRQFFSPHLIPFSLEYSFLNVNKSLQIAFYLNYYVLVLKLKEIYMILKQIVLFLQWPINVFDTGLCSRKMKILLYQEAVQRIKLKQ